MKLYKGRPIKSIVDTSALYISLNKLATTGQLSRNVQLIERTKVKLYLSRLYYYLAKYNIDVYLMGTKDHLSDFASRHSTMPLEQFTNNQELPVRPLPENLPLCKKCKFYTLPEDPHTGPCDGKMKDLPNNCLPQILQVIPSPPKSVEYEKGKSTKYRIGNILIGHPIYIDFPAIFQAMVDLPDARCEWSLSRLAKDPIDQFLYPSDSTQLAYLLEHIDDLPRYISSTITSANNPALFEIHPFVSSSHGNDLSQLLKPSGERWQHSRGILITLFLTTSQPSKSDLMGWPDVIANAQEIRRQPRFSLRVSEAVPVAPKVLMNTACAGKFTFNQKHNWVAIVHPSNPSEEGIHPSKTPTDP